MKRILFTLMMTFLLFGCSDKPREYLCSTSMGNYSPDFKRSLSLRPLNYISSLKSKFGIEEYELLFGVENYPVTCEKNGNAFWFIQKGADCKKESETNRIQFDPINGTLVVFRPKDMVVWSCSRVRD
jgi:hypothetical protein